MICKRGGLALRVEEEKKAVINVARSSLSSGVTGRLD